MPSDVTEVIEISHAQALMTSRLRYGYIKCRLVHLADRSFILPDVLMASGLTRKFYNPTYFYPNHIAFLGGDGSSDLCRFVIALPGGADLKIAFFRGDLVKRCTDNSFIYKCAFTVADDLPWPEAQGVWRKRGSRFELQLYHHTNAAGAAGIRASGEIWSSPWNIQGNKKLCNIAYGYFTSLLRIRNEADLREIAMSESGAAYFIPTNAPYDLNFATSLDVPRQTARDRNHSLPFWVDVEIISPSHIWLHRPMDRPAYYEVVLPQVFRVGVEPGQTLPINGTAISIGPANRKSFPYAIVGDADTHDGLRAPYHEEETTELAKIDEIPAPMEIMGRWYDKQNTHLFDDMVVETAILGDA